MLIDIFHDTACPWCRIGKKYLFDALAQWQDKAVIRWHAFLLDDSIPSQGVEFRTFMQARKGIEPAELNQLFNYTKQKGDAAGVKLNFDKIYLAVNTKLSHQLIALTPEEIKTTVVEAIYKAYFEDGLNIGDVETLVSIGKAAGMDVAELRTQLSENTALSQVMNDAATARMNGITSVPFLSFNNKVSISGSQSVEVFLQALNSAAVLEVSPASRSVMNYKL